MPPVTKKLLFEALLSLQEYSKEPRRDTLNLDAIGLAPDGGVQNIVAVYNQASEAEKDYWGRWYHHAKADVAELAQEFNLDFRLTAGLVAVLSPGNKWHDNLMAAKRMLSQAPKINAYPIQLAKAKRLLESGDFSVLETPKVKVFFASLLDPEKLQHELVLDSHAINVWRGQKVTLKDTQNPRAQALRAQMLHDYAQAAQQVGTSVQAVQAVTWYIWKYGKHLGVA
jgi:hypothetical protein